MIKLFGFGPAFGVPDPSSFVMKVDCYLRMAAIDYELDLSGANLQKAPKGKLPYIEQDGSVLADSQFILNSLDEKFNRPLDAWLSDEQRGWSVLATKSLDENLYWCLVYSRWIDEESWPLTKAAFFDVLPPVVRNIVPIIARRSVRKNLFGHGIGRHSATEIAAIADQTLQALSLALADKPYFMGDKPCNLDATAFGLLSLFALTTTRNTMTDLILKYDNLMQYCRRNAEQYYPGEFEAVA